MLQHEKGFLVPSQPHACETWQPYWATVLNAGDGYWQLAQRALPWDEVPPIWILIIWLSFPLGPEALYMGHPWGHLVDVNTLTPILCWVSIQCQHTSPLSSFHTTHFGCPCPMHTSLDYKHFHLSSGHMSCPFTFWEISNLSLSPSFSTSLPCYIFLCRSYNFWKLSCLFMSLSVYGISSLLKGEATKTGPCLSCSHSIPRASKNHAKSVLLNQVFVENAVYKTFPWVLFVQEFYPF